MWGAGELRSRRHNKSVLNAAPRMTQLLQLEPPPRQLAQEAWWHGGCLRMAGERPASVGSAPLLG